MIFVFVSPEEIVLHISYFLYEVLPKPFAWEEIPVLKVIEHDGNKALLTVWLEDKGKKQISDFHLNKET